MKKEKFLKALITTSMIFSNVALLMPSTVYAQNTTQEGADRVLDSKITNLKEILSANVNSYWEDEHLRVTKVQNDIYHVDEETSTHSADGPTNNPSSIYFIVGDNNVTMIDAGNGKANMFYDTNTMKSIYNVLTGEKNVKVLLTHSHGDHTGILVDGDVIPTSVNVYIEENDMSSLNQTVKDNYQVHSLKDGEKVQAGNHQLEVSLLNGHTDGAVVYIDKNDEVLFSGDTVGSGTVWLFGENDLVSYDQSINKLVEIIRDMENPIIYGGHRWQQFSPATHATENLKVLEIGKQYVLEMDQLLDDIKDDKNQVHKPYNPSPTNLGLYSEHSDLNNDNLYPGIVAPQNAIDKLQTKSEKENISGNVEEALNKIVTPIMQKDGTIKNYSLSDTLKSHLSRDNLIAIKDAENKILTIDQQLDGIFLTSNYINGKSEAGISYYNMINFYATLLQAQQMLIDNPDYQIVDNQGKKYDKALIDEFVGLVKQINDFDPTTNLQYDWKSAYDTEEFTSETHRGGTDVIATSKEGHISFEFHIDSHGWWGYDYGAQDSITGLILGLDAEEANKRQNELTLRYGQFHVIKMKEDEHGTWYMLNGTDLENPIIYVSQDGKEAFMIDVDFYGGYVINDVIKSIIGDKCESLKIFCTHNHGDHTANLSVIGKDDELRKITTIIWPENEPHVVLWQQDAILEDMVGKDLISDIEWKEVITVKDMEKFTVAGNEFQFIEITDEHTPGGGQLADLTHKVIYSGDSLGAQVHLGGTTITSDNAQAWLDGAKKVDQYIEENDIQYNIGGHTPYLNNPKFASWLAVGIEYAMENSKEDYSLIIVENGKVVNGTDRYEEIMSNGLNDREELNVCSLGYIYNSSQQSEDPEQSVKPETPINSNTSTEKSTVSTNNTKEMQTDNKVKTGDKTSIMGYVSIFALSSMGFLFLKKKKQKTKKLI